MEEFLPIKFSLKTPSFQKVELYVYVPTGSTYEDVKKIIEPFVEL